MDSDSWSALRLAADALCSFRTKFGVDLSYSNLCEIYVALNKFQLTQRAFKRAAVPMEISSLRTSLASEEARA